MKKKFLDIFFKNLKNKEIENTNTSIALSMNIICDKMHLKAKPIFEQYNLSTSEFDLIATLNLHDGGLTVAEVSDRMVFTSGGISKVVKKLELKKLIYKEESKEDKRSFLLHLEEKGKEMLSVCMPQLRENHNNFLGILDDTEKEIMQKALKKILYNLT